MTGTRVQELAHDAVRVDDRWYVLSTSSRADDRTRVLKHGETFAVYDRYGDFQHIGVGEQGLYHEGTRHLSRYDLLINERRPMLLNSTVKDDNSQLVVDLTTPDLYRGEQLAVAKGSVHVFRGTLLYEGAHYEHLRLLNYADEVVEIELQFGFEADYADIFEVRGLRRLRRGRDLEPRIGARSVTLGYRGLDEIDRHTRIEFSRKPERLDAAHASLAFRLRPGEVENLYVTIECHNETPTPEPVGYERALQAWYEQAMQERERMADLFSSNEQFNDWINRSVSDLHMLVTHTEHGPYPYAGVPWFSAPFGRDGILTALECLWVQPQLARGVLAFLAATQADRLDPDSDAEPGKILHEARRGELANLGEIPFRRYYGSVDATPLFVMLAGAYFRRTGERAFLESIWPNIERALAWIDEYGDVDGDGLVEYSRHSPDGLVQQGWKDSDDSIYHADGRLARGPIALCEVQGYVYEARLAAAELAQLFGERARAERLRAQAEALQARFNEAFWLEEIGTYAIALDGDKRPCAVRSSNAGQVLLSGITAPEYARRVASVLMDANGFSGWGVRTVARNEARYNPMSYHNGSIWPHDNALVAMGLARQGYKEPALDILTGLFNASIALDLHRLPELFCGFTRLPGQGPTRYPVACAPQAWASASVFYLLQACLGLEFCVDKPQLRFVHPQLPDYLQQLRISNLQVGSAVLDLVLTRYERDVSINVVRKEGDVEVAVVV